MIDWNDKASNNGYTNVINQQVVCKNATGRSIASRRKSACLCIGSCCSASSTSLPPSLRRPGTSVELVVAAAAHALGPAESEVHVVHLESVGSFPRRRSRAWARHRCSGRAWRGLVLLQSPQTRRLRYVRRWPYAAGLPPAPDFILERPQVRTCLVPKFFSYPSH